MGKGFKIYIIVVILALGFMSYSQMVGWRWIGATHTDAPEGERKSGNRYFYHK